MTTEYRYSGYVGDVIAVYLPADQGGATVIVFRADGSVHPNYSLNSPLALQWQSDVPNWQAVLAALPQPEPEPEPVEPDWIGFQMAIATNPNYQTWINAVAAVNYAVADAIPNSVSQKQIDATQFFLGQAIGIVPMPLEGMQELQDIINQFGIPLTLG